MTKSQAIESRRTAAANLLRTSTIVPNTGTYIQEERQPITIERAFKSLHSSLWHRERGL